MRAGLSTADLKLVAMGSMLVDHVAAVLLYPYVRRLPWGMWRTVLIHTHTAMHAVGRLAFPLFVFCLVEGFVHTHSRARYLGRIGVTALVSEFPFDLASALSRADLQGGQRFSSAHANVCFTLGIGLAVIWAADALLNDARADSPGLPKWAAYLLALGAIAAGCLIARTMRTDYSWFGVLAIVFAYAVKCFGHGALEHPEHAELPAMLVPLVVMARYELYALIAWPLTLIYNGEPGHPKHPRISYWFYPAHLLALGLLKVALFG